MNSETFYHYYCSMDLRQQHLEAAIRESISELDASAVRTAKLTGFSQTNDSVLATVDLQGKESEISW
jgi:hypothetical protein